MAKRPAFEDYLAPWETKEGDDITEGEVDKAKLKRFLWNLLGDKEAAETAAHDAKEEVKTLKKAQDDKAHEGDDELAKATRRAEQAEADAKAKQDKIDDLELDKVRGEVGTEKGLTEAQMGYLTGKTKAELETAADKFIEDNGLTPKGEKEGEEDDPDKVPQARPAGQAPRTPGDPDPLAVKGSDPAQWASDFQASRNPF